MDDLWEVSVSVPTGLGDVSAAPIADLSPGGFEQRDGREGRSLFVFYWPVEVADEKTVLCRTMKVMSALTGDAAVHVRQVSGSDWVQCVREGMGPVRVDPVRVVPPWRAGEAPDDTCEVVIAPGLAFGTGYHESTRLALRGAIEVIREGRVAAVLDVGCGTGVLAIAALKLGAGRAFGCDIDPAAVTSARRNAVRNGVSARLTLACCDVSGLAAHCWPSSYPLVIANLTAPIILSRAESLMAVTAPGGKLVLSGLYRELCGGVCDVLGSGWRVDRELSEGDWRALVCRRPS